MERKLQILDTALMDETSAKAKTSPRLRMNYNFHPELSDKVQRFINAMEPGTVVDIHHHKVDEMIIVLRGSVKALLYDDNHNVIDECVLNPANGVYGVQMPANVWHTVECIEPNTVLFELKEGPFLTHEQSGILK